METRLFQRFLFENTIQEACSLRIPVLCMHEKGQCVIRLLATGLDGNKVISAVPL
jgi:hypothetical protein